jgi:hypothetical protein
MDISGLTRCRGFKEITALHFQKFKNLLFLKIQINQFETSDQCGRDIPNENLFTMVETARRYGKY